MRMPSATSAACTKTNFSRPSTASLRACHPQLRIHLCLGIHTMHPAQSWGQSTGHCSPCMTGCIHAFATLRSYSQHNATPYAWTGSWPPRSAPQPYPMKKMPMARKQRFLHCSCMKDMCVCARRSCLMQTWQASNHLSAVSADLLDS